MFIWCKFLKQAFMWTHALFCMLSRAGSPWETGQASWYDDCIYSPCLRGSDKLGPAVARYTVILVTVLTPCSWESFVGKVFDFHIEYYWLFKGCMGRNDTTRLATVSVLYFFFSLCPTEKMEKNFDWYWYLLWEEHPGNQTTGEIVAVFIIWLIIEIIHDICKESHVSLVLLNFSRL